MKNFITILLLSVLLPGAAHSNEQPNLTLVESSSDSRFIRVDVRLSQAEGSPKPVLAELFIWFDREELRFTKAETPLTNKHMVAHVVDGTLVRLSLTGINMKTLPNGTIAGLVFERKNRKAARLRFSPQKAQFAPAAAARTIRLGPPLKIRIHR